MNPQAASLRPLPITARPHSGDTVETYIQRLARANHLRPSYLRRLLLNNPYALYGGSVDLDRLAAVANRHPDSLRRALQPRPSRRATAQATQSTASRQLRKQTDKRALFVAIRELAQREQPSIRALAEQFGVHRRTIRQALSTPEPPARRKQNYPAPRLDPAREVIDAMLHIEPAMPAGHIWERLLDEHDILTSYSTVRKYVAERRSLAIPQGLSP
jgi:hypothetical protein